MQDVCLVVPGPSAAAVPCDFLYPLSLWTFLSLFLIVWRVWCLRIVVLSVMHNLMRRHQVDPLALLLRFDDTLQRCLTMIVALAYVCLSGVFLIVSPAHGRFAPSCLRVASDIVSILLDRFVECKAVTISGGRQRKIARRRPLSTSLKVAAKWRFQPLALLGSKVLPVVLVNYPPFFRNRSVQFSPLLHNDYLLSFYCLTQFQ